MHITIFPLQCWYSTSRIYVLFCMNRWLKDKIDQSKFHVIHDSMLPHVGVLQIEMLSKSVKESPLMITNSDNVPAALQKVIQLWTKNVRTDQFKGAIRNVISHVLKVCAVMCSGWCMM